MVQHVCGGVSLRGRCVCGRFVSFAAARVAAGPERVRRGGAYALG